MSLEIETMATTTKPARAQNRGARAKTIDLTKKPARTSLSTSARKGASAQKARAVQEPKSLADLTRLLRDRLRSGVPSEYVRGKQRLRDELMTLLGCSSARADYLVDSMVARGHARFGRHPRFTNDPRFGVWQLEESP